MTRKLEISEKQTVYLVASGDMRLSANQKCWPAQQEMERLLVRAINEAGYEAVRAHQEVPSERHGFISSQRQGIEIFRGIPKSAPLIVAEAVWQYSHHVLAGLINHRGPILTVANWSGQWPGLVGMLNLNGSLTKAGVPYSTLWSETFEDEYFTSRLRKWLTTGKCGHDASHVRAFFPNEISPTAASTGRRLAEELREDRAIMGVFDEGCMGMFNAIIPDQLLHRTGIFKERLSQSALYFETTQTGDLEALEVLQWLQDRGMRFHTGDRHFEHLTNDQILLQCKMYVAAVRMADDFGCDLIGIQYQQGLKDLLPASDLVEGMLNNADRPPVFSRDHSRELFAGKPVIHFNEVDECAGIDALITNRVQQALNQPVETTLHDVRWGDFDETDSVPDYVWVLEISGAAPPAHFVDGWAGAQGFRQPAMYFPNGGSTLCGVSKPGEIVWSRVYVENDELKMDIGRGAAIELPDAETQRRWNCTTCEWPIMHAVFYGVSRDQFMAQHKANHVQVAYCTDATMADRSLECKAAFGDALGIRVNLCGTRNRDHATKDHAKRATAVHA